MKSVSAPLRIDLFGGALDIKIIPKEMGPTKIVSAAISERVTGTIGTSEHGCDGTVLQYKIPGLATPGSGLGSSGVANLVWLALVTDEKDPYVLADNVYNIEQATGVVGGTQDQFTSAFGGLLELLFYGERVFVKRITDSRSLLEDLSSRMFIVNTNIRRTSTDMSSKFIEDYKKGRNIDLVQELNALTWRASELFFAVAGNYLGLSKFDDKITHMLNREWDIRKCLYTDNVPLLDGIMDSIRHAGSGARVGIKMLGAAGGGCMLVYVPDRLSPHSTEREETLGRMRSAALSEGCTWHSVKIDPLGIIIENTSS
jgi:galactokinase/mevalonate kinase-like predicted kinase